MTKSHCGYRHMLIHYQFRLEPPVVAAKQQCPPPWVATSVSDSPGRFAGGSRLIPAHQLTAIPTPTLSTLISLS